MKFPKNIIIDDKYAEILRNMTGEQRVLASAEMFETAVALLRANIKEKHPDWSEEQIRKEIRKRLGNDPDSIDKTNR